MDPWEFPCAVGLTARLAWRRRPVLGASVVSISGLWKLEGGPVSSSSSSSLKWAVLRFGEHGGVPRPMAGKEVLSVVVDGLLLRLQKQGFCECASLDLGVGVACFLSVDVFVAAVELGGRRHARLEPMMYSEPTDCYPDREGCIVHNPSRMLQIYSLKLSQIPIDHKSVELYGYIAVRDYQDSLLNYIVNCNRDDPIIVQQGSLIHMAGPKRAISMRSAVLLEFDMRIKKGEQKENDLQLIDGASEFNEVTAPRSLLTTRIKGDCGAVDITRALVYEAVEATIEVVIPEVLTGFSLSISSFVPIYGLSKEIQLFHGTICESCALQRSVIAVTMKTWMHLKFKIGKKGSKNGLELCCSFEATNIGCASQQIMLDIASISAKVTWSSVPL